MIVRGIDGKSKVPYVVRLERLEIYYAELLTKMKGTRKKYICELCDEESATEDKCHGMKMKLKTKLASEMRARLVYYRKHS